MEKMITAVLKDKLSLQLLMVRNNDVTNLYMYLYISRNVHGTGDNISCIEILMAAECRR